MGVVAGLAAIGLDGLGSAAYGPEAALHVLTPLGADGLRYLFPVFAGVLSVLTIVCFSYYQTIGAYPTSGGAYSVARHNLGRTPSLVAAAALMVDYILNVAVAIAAGTAALISAFPALQGHTLDIALLILTAITVINLRGTQEAGLVLTIPTYVFIASFIGILGFGVVRTLTAGAVPVIDPPEPPAAAGAVSAWVLMRAFASGCSAMTGVEAVSNSVSAFKEPTVTRARWTLLLIVGTLGTLLFGVAFLARQYHVGAMAEGQAGYQSVLSQVVGAVIGRGPLYYIAMCSLLAVLCFSANTSFVGFPRLCRTLAQDRFLPEAFTVLGGRLVYTAGILFLTGSAAVLLVVFRAHTEHLVPLFAIGAITAFTVSQLGMTRHWQRAIRGGGPARARLYQLINGVGAAVTASTMVVLLVAKFVDGAWFILVAVPLLVLVFQRTSAYYARMAERPVEDVTALEFAAAQPPLVLVPISGWNKQNANAVAFAMRLSPEVTALHLSRLRGGDSTEDTKGLRDAWEKNVEEPAGVAGLPPPHLLILPSPYRRFVDPIIEQVKGMRCAFPDRLIAVVIPERVRSGPLTSILHTLRSERLRAALLRRGDRHLVVITVPWKTRVEVRAAA